MSIHTQQKIQSLKKLIASADELMERLKELKAELKHDGHSIDEISFESFNQVIK